MKQASQLRCNVCDMERSNMSRDDLSFPAKDATVSFVILQHSGLAHAGENGELNR